MACKLWAAIKKGLHDAFTFVQKKADVIAISATEEIKAALNGGAVGFLAKIIDDLTKGHVATDVVELLKKGIPKALEIELAIQGIPENATEQDILDFENRVLTAFGVTTDNAKLYTLLASQIYGLLHNYVESGEKLTFGATVKLIESAYQEYLSDLNAQQNPDA